MKKILIVLVLISLFLCGCSKNREVDEKVKYIKSSYSYLNGIVNDYNRYKNIEVIDTRSEEEYEKSHIIGSLNVPYNKLNFLDLPKDVEVIVYSTTSSLSLKSLKKIINLGFTNATYISGINDWPYDLTEY